MSLQRPLDCYRVLEIGTGPASYCGRVLADLGAMVIHLEPAGGDPMKHKSPTAAGTGISYLWANAGKSVLEADLDDPDIQRRVAAALAGFDVLIDGNSPGWLSARGLDPEALRQAHPHLVVASVSHFGQSGPYRDWQGSALVDFALAGCLIRSGLPDQAPCAPPYLLPYAIAGVTAASAVTAALWNRSRTGRGDWLDCTVVEALQAQADWSVPGYSATGNQAKRAGAGPLFRLFPTDDGWVRVINLSAKQWRAVKSWLGDPPEISSPEWDNPLYRAAHLDIQDQVFTSRFKGRLKRELFEDGQRHGVGIVPIYSPIEVMGDAHFAARGTFVSYSIPGGSTMRAPGTFVRMADAQPGPLKAPIPVAFDALEGPPITVAPGDGNGAPLAGIRVIEVGSGAVAPEITRVLAVLGADVIKIESMAQIDFMRLQAPNIESSSGWSSSNRNKRSVKLDIKHPDGREVGRALARAADVIVENNTAGVMDRLGIGYADVARENPTIVYLSSQAFGGTGPAAGYGGFGPTNQAVSGTTYLWNPPDVSKPEGVQAIHPDHVLGRMGSMAVIAALDELRRTGRGQHIDLGQAEFAIACIGEAFIESEATGVPAEARGNLSPLGAPHGVFPCMGDDQWVAITVETDDQWQRLRKVVNEETWSDSAYDTEAGRMADRDVIEAQLSAWTTQFTPIQVMRRLQAEGVPTGAALTTVQVLADVHFNERGYFDTVYHPIMGPTRMEGIPYKTQSMRHESARPAPLFGADTRAVLAEWLNMDDESFARLEAAGAIK